MIWLLSLLACTCSSPDPIKPTAPAPTAIVSGKTNVLVVVLDTVRADHLGFYGYDLPTSPNLDRWAADAVVFDQQISNCSWTKPSMGSIFTGLYPRTLGLYEERYDKLDASFTMLSERFQEHGYFTLGVTSNPNMNDVFGFDQGFDAYGQSGVAFGWMNDSSKQGREVFGRDTPLEDAHEMTDRALAILDSHAEPLRNEPFYLQVVYIDPHWPYQQPPEHEAAVAGSKKPGYDGGIHYIDAEMQRLFDGMASRGLLQDTLVVVAGDHGEGLWSHPGVPNTAWHGNTLYESVLHVPFVLHHPSLAARRVPDLTENLDIVPTIADLLGWGVPDGLPGKSLADVARGTGAAPQGRIVFSETDFRQNLKHSARTSTHKYIRNDDAIRFGLGTFEGHELDGQDRKQIANSPPEELYVLSAGMEMPRKNTPEAPETAVLRAALEQWERDFPARAPDQHDPADVLTGPDGKAVQDGSGQAFELDEATKNALKAIGYLEE
ncbi:MAG: sulfatase [Myxococcota bacterium]